jgi:hypothetical protein
MDVFININIKRLSVKSVAGNREVTVLEILENPQITLSRNKCIHSRNTLRL